MTRAAGIATIMATVALLVSACDGGHTHAATTTTTATRAHTATLPPVKLPPIPAVEGKTPAEHAAFARGYLTEGSLLKAVPDRVLRMNLGVSDGVRMVAKLDAKSVQQCLAANHFSGPRLTAYIRGCRVAYRELG